MRQRVTVLALCVCLSVCVSVCVCLSVCLSVEWIVRQMGVVHIFHCIDDSVIVGPLKDEQCEHGSLSLMQACDNLGRDNLGLFIADDKTKGPSTCLTVLGIEFDTDAMVLQLHGEKLERLRSPLATWRGKKLGQRRDLESLAGMLQHTSRVVQPGRTFMRCI